MRAWQWLVGIVGGAAAVAAVSSSKSSPSSGGGGSSSGDGSSSGGGSGPLVPPPPVGPAVPGLPQGKGVFVRHVGHGGDPELFAQRMEYLGMRHAWIQSMFHERTALRVNDRSRYREYGERLRAVGCTPWVWGFPRPESIDRFVEVSVAAMDELGAPGLLVNVESAWMHKPSDALRLMAACRAALGGRPLGITTYGAGPGRMAGFPWDAFASADFTVPQWYDMHNNLGPRYPTRAFARYVKGGYQNIMPAWSAMQQHPPELMQQMADESPIPSGAVSWWDLYWLLKSKERVEWVRNYRIPAPRSPIS